MIDIIQCARCGTQVAVSRAEGMKGICPKCLFEALVAPEEQEPARSPLELLEGQELGNYVVLGLVGAGGMGVVYRARQKGLERMVALKVLNPSGLPHKDDIERFFREARAAARLQHPNIVAIHEVVNARGYYFFTMDLIDGKLLGDVIEEGKLAPAAAPALVAKVARALHYAHEAGIIHRDLKPANILIDARDEPKVMDFGLAKDIASTGRLTATGTTMGTPAYMPPEQAEGGAIDARTDVYALGAVLYECLSGKPPFTGQTVAEIIRKVVDEEPLAPSVHGVKIPRDVETICLKALQKDPAQRYPSALAMAEDLERAARGEPIHGRRPGMLIRMRKHGRRLGAAAALLAVAGVVMFTRGGGTVQPTPEKPASGPTRPAASASKARLLTDKAEGIIETAWSLRAADRDNRVARLAEAMKVLDEAEAAEPGSAEVAFLRGLAHHAGYRYAEAVECFTKALVADPQHPHARYWRVLTNSEMALDDLTWGLTWPDAYRREQIDVDVKHLQKQARDSDEAEAAAGYAEAVDLTSRMVGKAWSMADAPLMMVNEVESLRGHARKAIQAKPDNPRGHFLLGYAEILSQPNDRESYAKAIPHLERGLQDAPADLFLLGHLIEWQALAGQGDRAVENAEAMVAMAPELDRSHILMATARAAAGDRPATRAALDDALRVTERPSYVRTVRGLGSLGLLASTDRFTDARKGMTDRAAVAEALANVDAAVAERPDCAGALLMRSAVNLAQNRAAEAQKDIVVLRAISGDVAAAVLYVESMGTAVTPEVPYTVFLADVDTRVQALSTAQRAIEFKLAMQAYPSPNERETLLRKYVVTVAREKNRPRMLEALTQLGQGGFKGWSWLEGTTELKPYLNDPSYLELRRRYALPPEEARAQAMARVAKARAAIEQAEKLRGVEDLGNRRGFLEKASASLADAIEFDAANAEAHFWRGVANRHLYRLDAALDDLTRAVRLDPSHEDAHYYRALTTLDQFVQLRTMFHGAGDAYRLSVLRREAAWLKAHGSRPDRAALAEAFPRMVEIVADLLAVTGGADSAGFRARVDALRALAEKAVEGDRTNPYAHFLRGQAELYAGMKDSAAYAKAIPHFQRAVEYGPSDLGILAALVHTQAMAGQGAEALRGAAILEAMAPDVEEASISSAFAHHAANDLEARDRILDRAPLSANVDISRAIMELGLVGDFKLDDLMAGAKVDPERYARAEASLNRALAREPELSMALMFRSVIQSSRGAVQEAAADIRRAMAFAPELARGFPTLAPFAAAPKELPPFEEYLGRIRQRAVDDVERLFHLCQARRWYEDAASQRALAIEIATLRARRNDREGLLRTLASTSWRGWARLEGENPGLLNDVLYLDLKESSEPSPEEARRAIDGGKVHLENAQKLTESKDRAQRSERLRQAAGDFEAACELAPASAEARLLLGQALQGRQQWREAIAAYGEAIARDPAQAEARYRRVTAYLEYIGVDPISWLEGASAEIRERMKDDVAVLSRTGTREDWREVAMGIAEFVGRGSPDQVRAHAEAAIKANPGNPYAPFVKGLPVDWSYREPAGPTGSREEAARAFREAVRLDPNETTFRIYLATTYLLMNEDAKALEEADAAVELSPRCDQAWMIRGRIHQRMGQAEALWKDYDRALEVTEDRGVVRLARAVVCLGGIERHYGEVSKENAARALSELNSGLVESPDHPWLLLIRGKLTVETGRDFERGIEDLKRYLERYPNHVMAPQIRKLVQKGQEDY